MIKKSFIYSLFFLAVWAVLPLYAEAAAYKYTYTIDGQVYNSQVYGTIGECSTARSIHESLEGVTNVTECKDIPPPASPSPSPGAGGEVTVGVGAFSFTYTKANGQKTTERFTTFDACESRRDAYIMAGDYDDNVSACGITGVNPPGGGGVGAPTGATPDEYELLAPLPGKDKVSLVGCKDVGTGPQNCQGFIDYVKTFIKLIIGLAGVMAVLFIVIGGFQYMSSDAVFKKQEGKKKITRALRGLLLVLGSVLILQTINPNILNFGKLITTSQQVGTEVRNTKPSPLQVGPAPTFNPGDYIRPGSGSGGGGSGGIGPGGGGYTGPIGSVPPLAPAQIGGWTDTTPAAGKKEIRVACGEDIQRAINKATAGDRVIIEGGCTYNTSLNIRKSNIMIIGGGQGARPIIKSNNEGAFIAYGIRDVAIIGIHFIGNNGKGSGINLTGNGRQNITIEDNVIQNFNKGIAANAWPKESVPVQNLVIRRNIIIQNQGIDKPQGLYADNVRGMLIEENVFDENGTRAADSDAQYDHNMYIHQGNTGVIIRGNIIARASSHGLQLRSGGDVDNNLFLNNPLAMLIDQQGRVLHNVVLNSAYFTHDGTQIGGFGIEVLRMRGHDVNMEGNIVTQKSGDMPQNYAFSLGGVSVSCGDGVAECIPPLTSEMYNINFSRNIAQKWPGEAYDKSPGKPTRNIVSLGNSWDPGVSTPNSTRDIASYIQSIGGTEGLGTFLAEARKQSRHNWRKEFTAAAVNDYIRQGFGR